MTTTMHLKDAEIKLFTLESKAGEQPAAVIQIASEYCNLAIFDKTENYEQLKILAMALNKFLIKGEETA